MKKGSSAKIGRIFFAGLAVVFAAACGSDTEVISGDYLDAIPDWEQLRLDIPGGEAQGRLRAAEAPIAEYYKITRQTVLDINGFVFAMLSVVDEVLQYPPTSDSGDSQVWAPEQPLSGLSPVVPRFTLTAVGENKFDFLFELRPKNEGEESYVRVWAGAFEREADTARRGRGEMTIDFDQAAAVDPTTEERGKIIIDYDIRTTVDRVINLAFQSFRGEDDPEDWLIDAEYSYREAADNTGEFFFTAQGDIFPAEDGSASEETLSVFTRWQGDGAGQAVVEVSGEDIDASGFSSGEDRECWDDGFHRRYFSRLAYWDAEDHPDWQASNVDNPIEDESVAFGDVAECPFSFESD
ncbi:MAG: hypothetical protein C4523_17640 [Myxococcales bacterium]|nr:MAG: hypothetical protein C4523_17640 [Myxococcales bacterium]